MEFDITEIDKKLLIRTLFAHSAPIGLGQAEYDVRKSFGETVDGISDEECEYLLYEYNHNSKRESVFGILDYHKGKPMKLNFFRKRNGRIITSSDSYDARNGRYRFLEAMLNTFHLDEIKITKKGYRQFVMTDLPSDLERTKEQNKTFKDLLKNMTEKREYFGKYWEFDLNKAEYKQPFMELIK